MVASGQVLSGYYNLFTDWACPEVRNIARRILALTCLQSRVSMSKGLNNRLCEIKGIVFCVVVW
jgi:hypothetical protein